MTLHCLNCGGDAIEPGEAGAPSHCSGCGSISLVREWPIAAPQMAPLNTIKNASVQRLLPTEYSRRQFQNKPVSPQRGAELFQQLRKSIE
jgi:hypothetical protein